MDRNELRNYFYNHKDKGGKSDLVIRIRNPKKNDKENDIENDIIYYKGIKILEIVGDKIIKIGEPNIYLYNNALIKNAIKKVNENKTKQEDKEIEVKKTVLGVMTTLRKSVYEKGLLKIKKQPKVKIENPIKENVEFSRQSLINIYLNLKKLKKNIKIEYHNKKESKIEYIYPEEKTIQNPLIDDIEKYEYITYTLDEEDISLEDLSEFEYTIRRYRNYDDDFNYVKIKSPSCTPLKLNEKVITTEEEIEEIINSCKKAVETYEDKVKFEREKNYQFQFMLSDLIKKKIRYETLDRKIDYNKIQESDYQNIYPFEQEYYILGKEGRIDSVFWDIKDDDSADLYLIELKVNESVIGGNNGVHKHLYDIKELIGKKDEIENMLKLLNDRRQILNQKEVNEINDIHFWTIIAYTDNNHKEACEKLLDIFYNADEQKCKYKLRELKKCYSEIESIDKDAFKLPDDQKYRHSLKSFVNQIGSNCDVKFFFDYWKKEEENEYRITDEKFEERKY